MPNTLRVVGGAAPSILTPAQKAARTVARRVASIASQLAQERLAVISGRWSTLTDAERASFVRLGQRYPLSPTKSTSSGKNLYVHLNTYRLLAGDDFLDTAPTLAEKVDAIGGYSLSITNTGSLFILQAVPDAAYTGRVLALGLKPQTPGTVLMDKFRHTVLSVSENIPLGGMSLSTEYAQVFGVADVGTRVGICLVPMSPMGFLGKAQFRDALVTAPASGLEMGE